MIKGWNLYETFIVIGTVFLLEGILWITCAFMNSLGNLIKEGKLDGLLLKPVDSQFIVSIYRGDLEDFVRIILGFTIIIYSLMNLSLGNFFGF